MRDPYDILGVAKSADEAEIKRAFRARPRNCIPTPMCRIKGAG